MSSKGTIILTTDNEHWYDETNERDGDQFRIYIEIDRKNMVSFEDLASDGILIGIRGDSELAGYIRKLREVL
jgi:hypothetical protein